MLHSRSNRWTSHLQFILIVLDYYLTIGDVHSADQIAYLLVQLSYYSVENKLHPYITPFDLMRGVSYSPVSE